MVQGFLHQSACSGLEPSASNAHCFSDHRVECPASRREPASRASLFCGIRQKDQTVGDDGGHLDPLLRPRQCHSAGSAAHAFHVSCSYTPSLTIKCPRALARCRIQAENDELIRPAPSVVRAVPLPSAASQPGKVAVSCCSLAGSPCSLAALSLLGTHPRPWGWQGGEPEGRLRPHAGHRISEGRGARSPPVSGQRAQPY